MAKLFLEGKGCHHIVFLLLRFGGLGAFWSGTSDFEALRLRRTFSALLNAMLRAPLHIGADPRGDPEHVFDEAAKATMRCGVAALGLETAAGRPARLAGRLSSDFLAWLPATVAIQRTS
jgi:hypothetical protein